jgi:hypothetical protein
LCKRVSKRSKCIEILQSTKTENRGLEKEKEEEEEEEEEEE